LVKNKILFVLHQSPPLHGAARVGDVIRASESIAKVYETRFIKIKGSESVSQIGRFSSKKIYAGLVLYLKVFWSLLVFRPHKIYFTPSKSGFALYRDVLISTLWKIYGLFFSADIYYHYHTKGIDEYVSQSAFSLKLTQFFVKNVTLILMSRLLQNDFNKVGSYKNCVLLPNGVPDRLSEVEFLKNLNLKYRNEVQLQALYLSQMTKKKGYGEVLNLARQLKGLNISFHFAGAWDSESDERYFFEYVKKYKLEQNLTYHGFVSGKKKQSLFNKAHVLLYPSKDDAFPLTILEALSFGIPVLATAEGAIPSMLNEKTGIIIHDINKFSDSMEIIESKFINKTTAKACRSRYKNFFSLEVFDDNLIKILKE